MNICIYYTEGLLWAKLKNENENINLEWTMLNLITESENFQSDLILFLHNYFVPSQLSPFASPTLTLSIYHF